MRGKTREPYTKATDKRTVSTDKQLTPDEMAKAIQEIADGFKAWQKSKLKERTILILLAHATGLNQGIVQSVLHEAANLDKKFLKP